jgi:antitoxin component YwqK of YwqJK toxin-antitoxin module
VYKKLKILFILLCCIATSYSQTEERVPNAPRGVKNKRDELRRRQEVWKVYSNYGDLISETEYKNDKKEGKCTIYYPEGGDTGGKPKEEIQYFDGKKDGPYVKKYLSGQTALEGENNLGVRVGLWTAYYEDGQIKTEGNYVSGKKDGEWKYYNRKGVLTKVVNYTIVVVPPAAKTKTDTKTKGKPAIKK